MSLATTDDELHKNRLVPSEAPGTESLQQFFPGRLILGDFQ
jgi:hypothetical protein